MAEPVSGSGSSGVDGSLAEDTSRGKSLKIGT